MPDSLEFIRNRPKVEKFQSIQIYEDLSTGELRKSSYDLTSAANEVAEIGLEKVEEFEAVLGPRPSATTLGEALTPEVLPARLRRQWDQYEVSVTRFLATIFKRPPDSAIMSLFTSNES